MAGFNYIRWANSGSYTIARIGVDGSNFNDGHIAMLQHALHGLVIDSHYVQ